MAITDSDMARAAAKRCWEQYGVRVSHTQAQNIADAIRNAAGRRVDVNKLPAARFKAAARRVINS